ncbi:D-inositol-3-phosphate glycosyltransferase [Cellulomonas denverensis]|uniref:D-inositol-3-phosphate glycosyltransferase n=1 Tax=Cellulomonas denverensis TaxID=264297 RepID=A0A7X6KW48_9CELL|nr:D-inositol-3-phosphate glycosyltransferase [Cellulomonas denverensis]NKY22940.1 D-inositol-3-phosphate glycosyltransferase [Cellulomonas denverensis]
MLSVHTSPLDQPGTGDAGGMNVYIAELSRALARRGATVEIYTRATSSTQPDTVPLDGDDERVLVHHVLAGPYEGLDKNDLPGQLCAMTAGVLRSGAHRPAGWFDVVHAHYWLSGQVGWLAAERWDVPMVATMHTLARVKNATLAPDDTPEPPGREIGEEQVVAAADALIANTAEEAHELVELYDADPATVHVVAPGVDLRTFTPARDEAERMAWRRELGLPTDRDVLLFAGRVQPLKAPDVLVRALGVLRAQGRPVPLLVVLGGPSGRPGALRDLRALAEACGVSDQVWFRPPVARPVLARWLGAADLVAMPSRSESFGLVAVEAQAAGTPVVATAVGGLRSVVADGISGRQVRGHDPARWADAIAALLADPAVRTDWRRAARRVAAGYGWDATAEQVLKVYALAAQHRRA